MNCNCRKLSCFFSQFLSVVGVLGEGGCRLFSEPCRLHIDQGKHFLFETSQNKRSRQRPDVFPCRLLNISKNKLYSEGQSNSYIATKNGRP